MLTTLESGMRHLAAAFALMVIFTTSRADAHVTLKDPTGVAGRYQVMTFRVPHGCGESPTVALRVTIPAEILIAKPAPKPGWRLEVTQKPLAEPRETERGGIQIDHVVEVAWTGGKLPGEYFDEFSILVFLPKTPGALYFPTSQICEAGESRWVEIPPEGKSAADVPYPAPSVLVVPAPP